VDILSSLRGGAGGACARPPRPSASAPALSRGLFWRALLFWGVALTFCASVYVALLVSRSYRLSSLAAQARPGLPPHSPHACAALDVRSLLASADPGEAPCLAKNDSILRITSMDTRSLAASWRARASPTAVPALLEGGWSSLVSSAARAALATAEGGRLLIHAISSASSGESQPLRMLPEHRNICSWDVVGASHHHGIPPRLGDR